MSKPERETVEHPTTLFLHEIDDLKPEMIRRGMPERYFDLVALKLRVNNISCYRSLKRPVYIEYSKLCARITMELAFHIRMATDQTMMVNGENIWDNYHFMRWIFTDFTSLMCKYQDITVSEIVNVYRGFCYLGYLSVNWESGIRVTISRCEGGIQEHILFTDYARPILEDIVREKEAWKLWETSNPQKEEANSCYLGWPPEEVMADVTDII